MRRLFPLSLLAIASALTLAADPGLPSDARAALAVYRDIDFDAIAKPQRGSEAPHGWKERLQAEWELASIEPEYVPALEALLKDESHHVRHLAARSIGIAGDENATSALAEVLLTEKHSLVQVALIEALARTGGEGALEAVEAKQTPGADKGVLFAIGLARRQLKGGAWDVASIRAEHREARGTELAVVTKDEKAPELALPSPDGPVNLSVHEGKPILLVFTQGDRGTDGSRHLARLRSEKQKLQDWDYVVIVVDPHEKERTKAWSERLRLPFVVCSDPAGRAQAKYGVARQLIGGGEWLPSPAWFLIDKTGLVAWSHVGKSAKDHPPLGTVLPLMERVKNNEILRD